MCHGQTKLDRQGLVMKHWLSRCFPIIYNRFWLSIIGWKVFLILVKFKLCFSHQRCVIIRSEIQVAKSNKIKAEKNDMESSSFIGSYSAVVTPNYVSVPLKRIKSNVRSRAEIRKEPWSDFHQNGNDANLQDEEVIKFHSQKDKHQLYRRVQQVFDYIYIKSSSVVIGYGKRLVSILCEEQNQKHVMQFLTFFNYSLRHNHFIEGHWHKYTHIFTYLSLHWIWQTFSQSKTNR